jgi:hypothetical protein
MADDLTPGEIARSLKRIEDTQLKLASDSVPAKLWAAQYEALIDKLADHARNSAEVHARLERQIEEMRKNFAREMEKQRTTTTTAIDALRTEVTEQPTRWADKAWTRSLAALVVVLTLAGVVIAALSLGGKG